MAAACRLQQNNPAPSLLLSIGTGNWGRGHEPDQPVISLGVALAACVHTKWGEGTRAEQYHTVVPETPRLLWEL